MDLVKITEFEARERLDKVLVTAFPQYSRSALEKLISSDLVAINGKVQRSSYRLKETDTIEVDLQLFTRPIKSIDLPIVYQDDDVLVINKPAGVLTHAKGTLHNEATVATFIKPFLNGSKEWKDSNRAGIVHRLDRGTSGIIVCAKNEASQTFLQKQFAGRNVKKTYAAIIAGHLLEPKGRIDVPIERNPKQPATFRPGINGKSAQTDFTVTKASKTHSMIELNPYTGRTHQLRVHLQYLNHPIVGDKMYNGEEADRLMLHAAAIELTLPSKERKTFNVPIPDELTAYLT